MVRIIHALELLLCRNVNTREENPVTQQEDQAEEHNSNAVQANEVDSRQDLQGNQYVQVTLE